MKKEIAEKLADLIEKNPKCNFHIDNDGWYITTAASQRKDETIADSSEYDWDTEWYGGGNCYGAGLAEALVILLNRSGYKIQASSV